MVVQAQASAEVPQVVCAVVGDAEDDGVQLLEGAGDGVELPEGVFGGVIPRERKNTSTTLRWPWKSRILIQVPSSAVRERAGAACPAASGERRHSLEILFSAGILPPDALF